MSVKGAVYKCSLCGNITEELWDGKTEPQCCGQQMVKMTENTTEAAKEKHIPVIVRQGSKVTVKIGEVAHPMTAEHYILFVELIVGADTYRHDFKTGDTVPEAVFMVDESVKALKARAYCNLHGFWATS